MSLVQGLHDDWYTSDAPDDVEVLTVLVDDTQGNPAESDDCAAVVDYYGLTFPVLGDPERQWLLEWGGSGGTSQHSYTVLNTNGTISWRMDDGNSATVSMIAQMVEESE